MENKDLIENEAEKTLQSLDGISRAEANPFLFTKISARLDEPEKSGFKFNFKLALGVVIACIFINLAAFIFIPRDIYTGTDTSTNTSVKTETREDRIKSFASEYSSINNIYFY